MNHHQHAQRLRQLAARTGLDGIAEEMRAIADELDAALAAQGEPVGEVFTMEALGTTPGKPFCHVLLNRTLPTGTKLYTAPPAPAKPMTDEEIDYLKQGPSQSHRDFARAVEAHHGITADSGEVQS